MQPCLFFFLFFYLPCTQYFSPSLSFWWKQGITGSLCMYAYCFLLFPFFPFSFSLSAVEHYHPTNQSLVFCFFFPSFFVWYHARLTNEFRSTRRTNKFRATTSQLLPGGYEVTTKCHIFVWTWEYIRIGCLYSVQTVICYNIVPCLIELSSQSIKHLTD